jgi:hypothetical protein
MTSLLKLLNTKMEVKLKDDIFAQPFLIGYVSDSPSLNMLYFEYLGCSSAFCREQDVTTGMNRERCILILVRLCSNITALHGEVPTPSRQHSMPPAIDHGGSAGRKTETE